MTAHRSQGSTVDRAHVAIPTNANLSHGLFYVAMTRGTELNLALVGVPSVDHDAAASHRTLVTRLAFLQGPQI